jgi:hypothetical protein
MSQIFFNRSLSLDYKTIATSISMHLTNRSSSPRLFPTQVVNQIFFLGVQKEAVIKLTHQFVNTSSVSNHEIVMDITQDDAKRVLVLSHEKTRVSWAFLEPERFNDFTGRLVIDSTCLDESVKGSVKTKAFVRIVVHPCRAVHVDRLVEFPIEECRPNNFFCYLVESCIVDPSSCCLEVALWILKPSPRLPLCHIPEINLKP